MVEIARDAKHWADLKERGADWGPALMAFIYRTLGRGVCMAVLLPVVLYFYLSGFRQRRASLSYLGRVWAANGRSDKPNHWNALAHFFAFGESLVDKFAAWTGQLRRDSIDQIDAGLFEAMRNDPRGCLIISAHIGATEVLRALAARHQPRRVSVVMHTNHAKRFNDMIQRFAPGSMMSLIDAADFNIDKAVELSAAVERGDFLVIMADRVPAEPGARSVEVDFLGAPAAFPLGPFILAAALKCPTYTLFCPKNRGRHRVHFALFSEAVSLPRGDRMGALKRLVESYARTLEPLVKETPYQWFNFYDFWAPAPGGKAV